MHFLVCSSSQAPAVSQVTTSQRDSEKKGFGGYHTQKEVIVQMPFRILSEGQSIWLCMFNDSGEENGADFQDTGMESPGLRIDKWVHGEEPFSLSVHLA